MLKRDLHLFVRCVLPAALLTVLFALVCSVAAVTASKGAEELYVPVKAAVVDGEDSIISRMLVKMVGDMDYISGMMEIERFGMEDMRLLIFLPAMLFQLVLHLVWHFA